MTAVSIVAGSGASANWGGHVRAPGDPCSAGAPGDGQPLVQRAHGDIQDLVELAPSAAGTLKFRDVPAGTASQTSAQSTLAALPAVWSPGVTYFNSPMSAYGQ